MIVKNGLVLNGDFVFEQSEPVKRYCMFETPLCFIHSMVNADKKISESVRFDVLSDNGKGNQ